MAKQKHEASGPTAWMERHNLIIRSLQNESNRAAAVLAGSHLDYAFTERLLNAACASYLSRIAPCFTRNALHDA